MKSGVMEVVDLFEREQKRERKERFLKLVGICLLAIVAVSWGGDTEFGNSIAESIMDIYPYIKIGVSAILFIFFLAKAIPAVMGSNKEANWWELLGIIGAIALVNAAPTIYNSIMGSMGSGLTFTPK